MLPSPLKFPGQLASIVVCRLRNEMANIANTGTNFITILMYFLLLNKYSTKLKKIVAMLDSVGLLTKFKSHAIFILAWACGKYI